AEVTPRKLPDRPIAFKEPPMSGSLLEKSPRVLLALTSPAGHQACELSRGNQMRQPLTIGRDPGSAQDFTELLPRQLLAALERRADRAECPTHGAVVQLELPVTSGHALPDLRAGEVQHPVDVFGEDEVPRRAQDVRAQDRAAVIQVVDLRLR